MCKNILYPNSAPLLITENVEKHHSEISDKITQIIDLIKNDAEIHSVAQKVARPSLENILSIMMLYNFKK